MNILRRLSFDLWYLRRPPWDSGIVPPEVEEFIKNTPPGRALDLGCGTGTSSLALAQAGWTVTGVDYCRRAINIAKQKSRTANARVDFMVADVTRLPSTLSTLTFDLVLDIGCYHGFPPSIKAVYLNQLKHLLTLKGTWLLYGFFKPDESPVPVMNFDDSEVNWLRLIKQQDGMEKMKRPSAWLWFQKAINPKGEENMSVRNEGGASSEGEN